MNNFKSTKALANALKAAATVLTMAMALPAAAALYSPYGVAVDPNTKALYIADATQVGRVAKYNPQTKSLTTFVTVDNPYSLAVNSNGVVYAGIVGKDTRIAVYDAKADLVNTLQIPSDSSPLNLTIDANNDVFMTKGHNISGQVEVPEVYLYTSDNSFNYAANGIIPYSKLQTIAYINSNTHYSLTTDNGKIYIIAEISNVTANMYDLPVFVSGHMVDFLNNLGSTDPTRLTSVLLLSRYIDAHSVQTNQSYSSVADVNHNILSTDRDSLTIKAVSTQYPSKVLLGNLPSQPFGIAYDGSRARIYVSFPQEHLVRGYTVNYATQNGVKVPTSLTLATTIQ
jgi:hypothetical protein